MERAIEVSGLVKVYDGLRALDGISFDVYRGEVFSLLGPNGAGKTTTVEILAGLRRPTSGMALVLGFDVVKEAREVKRRIGMLPQEFSAMPELTVEENVAMIAEIYGCKPDLRSILEGMGLWEHRAKRYKALSGGLKRRLGIAMALVNDPELLFLDEPTTGLDPQGRRGVWSVIRELKSMGKTVLLTTHYMEEAERLSDRAAIMIGGRIVAMGSIRDLIDRYGMGVKVVVRGAGKFERELIDLGAREVAGDLVIRLRDRRMLPEILSRIQGLGIDIDLEVTSEGLEAVFLRVVGARITEDGELA